MNMSALEITRITAGGVGMDMMTRPAVWGIRYAGLMFVMWWVMMIAMMLLLAAMSRKQRETGKGDASAVMPRRAIAGQASAT